VHHRRGTARRSHFQLEVVVVANALDSRLAAVARNNNNNNNNNTRSHFQSVDRPPRTTAMGTALEASSINNTSYVRSSYREVRLSGCMRDCLGLGVNFSYLKIKYLIN